MNAKWAAGAGLAILILSPRVRQQLEKFMDSLTNHSAEIERAKQQKEADRLLEFDRKLDELEATLRTNLREILDRHLWTSETETPPTRKVAIPAPVEADARWLEVVVTPAVILLLGKRGSGKSALSYRLLELFRYRLPAYVVGAPEQSSKLLPDWIGTVPTLEDLPPDCIALVDEAYIQFHSRRSMAKESAGMSQQLNLSRQRNQTLIFVSQEARQIDRNIASSASVVIFKEMGMLQPEFDRPELRKLVEQAKNAMAGLGKEIKKWGFVYSPDADFMGLMESQLPSFWKPSMSRLYAAGPSSTARRPVAKLSAADKANRAKELKGNGYSHSKIANDLGVSKATVVNYLKGYPYQK